MSTIKSTRKFEPLHPLKSTLTIFGFDKCTSIALIPMWSNISSSITVTLSKTYIAKIKMQRTKVTPYRPRYNKTRKKRILRKKLSTVTTTTTQRDLGLGIPIALNPPIVDEDNPTYLVN